MKYKTLTIKAIEEYFSVPQKGLLKSYFEELLNTLDLLSGSYKFIYEFVRQVKSSSQASHLELEEFDNELYKVGETERLRKYAQDLLNAIKLAASVGDQSYVVPGQQPTIKAKRIKAENVVSGMQIISSDKNVSQNTIKDQPVKGSITAEEIDATNIVSGVQFLSGIIPSSIDEVLVELKKVNEEIRKSLDRQTFTKASSDMLEVAIKATEKEIESPKPSIEALKDNLETYEHILTTSSNLFNGARKIGGQILSIAPIVSALIQILAKFLH